MCSRGFQEEIQKIQEEIQKKSGKIQNSGDAATSHVQWSGLLPGLP